MKAKEKLILLTAATVFGMAAIVQAGSAPVTGAGAPHTLPPNSHAFGTTPAQVAASVLRGVLMGDEQSIDYIGPFKRVNAQSYTTIGGSGTIADPTVEVGVGQHTVKPGTPLFRLLFYMYRETYLDGSVDPQFSDAVVLNQVVAEIEVTLDGKVLISDENKAHFYVPETPFDPIVVYPEPSPYGSINAIAHQGVYLALPPLATGTHVLKTHLREVLTPEMAPVVPPEGISVISDSVVTIVVTPN